MEILRYAVDAPERSDWRLGSVGESSVNSSMYTVELLLWVYSEASHTIFTHTVLAFYDFEAWHLAMCIVDFGALSLGLLESKVQHLLAEICGICCREEIGNDSATKVVASVVKHYDDIAHTAIG